MDRQPVLEGERVRLRPMREDDWDALFAIASDPAVWEQHPIHDRWREEVFAEFFADALANEGALVVIDRAKDAVIGTSQFRFCLLYTSPSPRDQRGSRMPSSA